MNQIIKLSLLFFFTSATILAQDVGDTYISEWKKFYPTKALKAGMRASVFQYEDFSTEKVYKWQEYNQGVIEELFKSNSNIDPIDKRLLRVQAQSELDKWYKQTKLKTSLSLYTQYISNAIVPIFEMDYLLSYEKSSLIYHRLTAIEKLVIAAETNLRQASKSDLEKGIADLSEAHEFLENDLLEKLQTYGLAVPNKRFEKKLATTIESIKSLRQTATTRLRRNIIPADTVLGLGEFSRRLKLYTDSKLTPTQLTKSALDEIKSVKVLMAEVSLLYIQETYPTLELPKNDSGIIKLALADMEKDAPLNSTDYLEFWQALAADAVAFIKEKDIATLPKNNTLRIQTAPESAGPAARIGWVASAPPFDPNPVTTLNLPSIPETLPKQEQIDFWASFNKPFNRMIVIHELYPGHYMQLKISRETPHPLRMLFPYGIYIEGWATFTEKVLLDAGWEKGNHLTLLAHLRKRLENANRAFTSVQVHCNNWKQEEVMKFSTETSLLAPQFAKSLWGRIENSPMQLTSYFLGGAQFTELLKTEKERLGAEFDLKLFMDTIMKAGAIPIEEFYDIFKQINPN